MNVIGEHTDYNDGYVLPIALQCGVLVAASRRDDIQITLLSLQQPEPQVRVSIDDLRVGAGSGWAKYVLGVIWALLESGHAVGGLDLVIDGDVPVGAGLSSSAALECAAALACTDLFALDIDRPALAELARHAEDAFVGVPVGIMDPSASLLCKVDHALFLDARSLARKHIPFGLAEAALRLLIIDTQAPHRLVAGEYAARRRTCEQAAAALRLPALRDIHVAYLEAAMSQLPDRTMRRRVRHVVSENARVLAVVDLLRAGETAAIGPLLTESHLSLRDDYEVSSRELDIAVAAALDAGALGARMTGAGFGGSAIALVRASEIDTVSAAVEDALVAHQARPPRITEVIASDGARRVK